jgi:2,5-diamino-6-(ribosylamino)-4(3H)-pyrimidinone 5'-phosphate reductase
MNRPYVIINCAMSADGKTALPWRKQFRLSSEEDMSRVHQLRHECDAVLVGVGTILADDPKLTVKEKYITHPRQPLRVVLDGHCRTPENALVCNEVADTLIITKPGCRFSYTKPSIESVSCALDKQGFLDIPTVLDILFKKGVQKLLVEGGGTVIWQFLSNYLVDEIYVFIAPVIIGGKHTPTCVDGDGISAIDKVISLEIIDYKSLGNGILMHYKPNFIK